MRPILHTQRFTLTPLQNTPEHNEHMRQMMQSEEVQKYIRGHAYSEQEVAESFKKIAANTSDQFGMWLIFDGKTCLGMCLLKGLPTEEKLNYYETGYWLKPKFWGMGVAGEVASRMVKYAFDELNLPCVVGVTHAENLASQKSLEKAGLTRHGNIKAYELDLPFFKLDNPHHMPCSKPTIQTERFRLIPWRNKATQNKPMVWMMKSPEVQEYVNGKPYTDEQLDGFLPKLAAATNQQRGFGTWMIYDMNAAEDICVGIVFLKSSPLEGEKYPYEIGYWLMPEFWGQGIAAEVADHIVSYGFEQLNLKHIVGITEVANIASQKSMLNIGFTRIADFVDEDNGEALPFFEIKNKNHKKSNKPSLQTKRFTMLPWVDCPEYKHHVTEMMQDAAVQKYIYEHVLSDQEMHDQLSRMTKICQLPDLGYWMIYENNTCVGMALLKPFGNGADDGTAEIGYWLKQEFWGNGIAGEVTARLITYAFNDINLASVMAVTHKDNIASQKSLLNAGMLRNGSIEAYENDLPFFEIKNQHYHA